MNRVKISDNFVLFNTPLDNDQTVDAWYDDDTYWDLPSPRNRDLNKEDEYFESVWKS